MLDCCKWLNTPKGAYHFLTDFVVQKLEDLLWLVQGLVRGNKCLQRIHFGILVRSTYAILPIDECHSLIDLYPEGSVSPYCVFQPSSTLEVSTMVLLARLTQCPFAVKGGGHAAFAGASSIEGGITLSMVNFNKIKPSAEKKTVDIGPGNRWVQVYNALDAQQMGVVGGRVSAP